MDISFDSFCWVDSLEEEEAEPFVFGPGVSEDHEKEKALVYEYLRVADRCGSDVRLDIQVPYRPKAWPRSGIRSRLWHWKVVMGYPWKASLDSHINLYELLALSHSIKWRLRNCNNIGSRVLHLVDSQVVCSICAKGRIGSRKLRGTLRRLKAWILAGSLHPCYGY